MSTTTTTTESSKALEEFRQKVGPEFGGKKQDDILLGSPEGVGWFWIDLRRVSRRERERERNRKETVQRRPDRSAWVSEPI